MIWLRRLAAFILYAIALGFQRARIWMAWISDKIGDARLRMLQS
jgi:hypothetical protein